MAKPPGWTAQDEEDYQIARGESGGRIASRAQVMANRKRAQASMDDWDAWFASLPEGAQLHYNHGSDDFVAAIKVGAGMKKVALIGDWRADDLENYRRNPNYPYPDPAPQRFGGRGTIVEHPSFNSQRHKAPDTLPIRMILGRDITPLRIADIETIRRAWPAEWMRLLVYAPIDELKRRLDRAAGAGIAAPAAARTGPISMDALMRGETAPAEPPPIGSRIVWDGDQANDPHSGEVVAVGEDGYMSIRWDAPDGRTVRVPTAIVPGPRWRIVPGYTGYAPRPRQPLPPQTEEEIAADYIGVANARAMFSRGQSERQGYRAQAPPPRASTAAPRGVARKLYVRRRGAAPVEVQSVEDAQRRWNEFVARSGGGVSEVGNGVTVVDSEGVPVARISYNGRIWLPGSEYFDEGAHDLPRGPRQSQLPGMGPAPKPSRRRRR